VALLQRSDTHKRASLLLGWQPQQRTQGSFIDNGAGQWVAKANDGLQDLGCEIKEAEHLGDAGASHPKLARQISSRGALAVIQHALPFPCDDDRVAVLPGRLIRSSRRLEKPGWLCALEVVDWPRCSPIRRCC